VCPRLHIVLAEHIWIKKNTTAAAATTGVFAQIIGRL
jgi:hypothetical protein